MENSNGSPEGISIFTYTIHISGACCSLENAQKIHESSPSSFEVRKCDSMFGGCSVGGESRPGTAQQLPRSSLGAAQGEPRSSRSRRGEARQHLRRGGGWVVVVGRRLVVHCGWSWGVAAQERLRSSPGAAQEQLRSSPGADQEQTGEAQQDLRSGGW